MNILFLTLLDFKTIEEQNIYTDLLRQFVKHNHNVFVISPVERKYKQKTHILKEESCQILKLRIGNIQKTNLIEKGISTLLLEPCFKSAIKRYFSDVKFDLVLYSTPPITLENAVKYVKKRDNANTYLLLKDIFPQNAVDMEMLSKRGLKSVLYRYFRKKEKKLYLLSDTIGCMSQANVNYLMTNNSYLDGAKIEICPNAIEVRDVAITCEEKTEIRNKYGVPIDKKIFVYGGNLGKPQGVDFIIKCLESEMNHDEVFFLVIGSGTEYNKIKTYFEKPENLNIKIMPSVARDEFDTLVAACDVGMIFLDHKFSIPNFPSRLLSYMQASIPVLACTDVNTDVGQVIVEGEFGWWSESNSVKDFSAKIEEICELNLQEYGKNAYKYLNQNYTADLAYRTVMGQKYESVTNK